MTAHESLRIAAVVVAAGSGERFGRPKHSVVLGGKPLWRHGVSVLEASGISPVIVVGDVAGGIPGGDRRRDSVKAGISAVRGTDWVLVHDAARPLASLDLVERLLQSVRTTDADGVVPGVAVTDTVKRVDGDNRITQTVERSSLVAVQTPQAFRTTVLLEAHDVDPEDDVTDDAGLVERIGGSVIVIEGETDNLKVTYPADLERAESILERRRPQ